MSSRARTLAAALVAAALSLPVALAVADDRRRAGVSAAPGPASVALLDCTQGKRETDRTALFRGEMKQIPAATRMRMRLSLSEKVGTSPWRGVGPHANGAWRNAKPGVQRFAYRQRVVGLKAATKYRMAVDFQWLDDAGEVVASSRARSRPCRQRGKLPNLGVRDDVFVKPGPTAGTYRYVVRIGNNGPLSSPRTEVRFSVDGAEVDTRPVGRLRSGKLRTLQFVGPACSRAVAARIDPKDAIREITEQDNARTSACTVPQ